MSVNVFFCYAHEDEPLLKRLKKQLTPMQRQGLIALWHDRDISAGTAWEQEISEQLNSAQIILLLISPDFMDSDYCYSKEMQRALERHHRKEARVIPVILRPIDWQDILGDIQALPTDAQPVLSPLWHSPEEAFYDVAQGIRKVVMQLTPRTLTGHTDEVYSVALSADGLTLVSGSRDQTIKVWNLSTGQAVRTLTGHTDAVISVAISADGQTLVSGSSDTTVKVRGV